jgi:hypothetical protein
MRKPRQIKPLILDESVMRTTQQTFIYCDLDGVIHRWPCPEDEMFDPDCIGHLAEAIKAHDVGLVVTSTWRLEWPLKLLQSRLGPLGTCLMGVTPEIDDPFLKFGRYYEVLQHLARSWPAGTRWVVIDDEPGRYPDYLDNLILTDPRVGFSEEDALRLSRWLGQA